MGARAGAIRVPVRILAGTWPRSPLALQVKHNSVKVVEWHA